MKIIKQFESNEWAIKRSKGYTTTWDGTGSRPRWTWGLGDDGRLYCKGWIAGRSYSQDWYRYEDVSFGISLDEMKKIIKEFGHWLVWI